MTLMQRRRALMGIAGNDTFKMFQGTITPTTSDYSILVPNDADIQQIVFATICVDDKESVITAENNNKYCGSIYTLQSTVFPSFSSESSSYRIAKIDANNAKIRPVNSSGTLTKVKTNGIEFGSNLTGKYVAGVKYNYFVVGF